MRIFITALLMLAGSLDVSAEIAQFHAGVIRSGAASTQAGDILYWYPTQVDEVAWKAGPFTMPATRNAPVADGRFPLLLLSHGGGQSGGTPLLLRDLAAGLARQGFIVVAPFHGKAGLQERPAQMNAAFEAAEADQRLREHIDGSRIGAIGFSLGGAVALELAGAVPNAENLAQYCTGHPQDAMSCSHAPTGRDVQVAAPTSYEARRSINPSVRALALFDPYAALFQRPELVNVKVPVLIFRPVQSEFPAGPNSANLTSSLPTTPDFRQIPGKHFIFADVCPESISVDNDEICRDPDGVDRATVHRSIETQVGTFFHEHLR